MPVRQSFRILFIGAFVNGFSLFFFFVFIEGKPKSPLLL